MRIIKQDMRARIFSNKAWWCVSWLKNDLLHREDGPAEVLNDGREYYFLEGKHAKNYLKESYKNIFI